MEKKDNKETKEEKKIKKPKMLGEFKDFIMRGNVIDMAVGVIIGGAFGKIVTSLVNDIIMPAISLITGKINIASLKFEHVISEDMAINLNYGLFLQTIIDFLIISLCIFLAIKAVSKLSRKKKEEVKDEVVPPSNEEVLLAEIRDILKKK